VIKLGQQIADLHKPGVGFGVLDNEGRVTYVVPLPFEQGALSF
jgi:hypothetical protein